MRPLISSGGTNFNFCCMTFMTTRADGRGSLLAGCKCDKKKLAFAPPPCCFYGHLVNSEHLVKLSRSVFRKSVRSHAPQSQIASDSPLAEPRHYPITTHYTPRYIPSPVAADKPAGFNPPPPQRQAPARHRIYHLQRVSSVPRSLHLKPPAPVLRSWRGGGGLSE